MFICWLCREVYNLIGILSFTSVCSAWFQSLQSWTCLWVYLSVWNARSQGTHTFDVLYGYHLKLLARSPQLSSTEPSREVILMTAALCMPMPVPFAAACLSIGSMAWQRTQNIKSVWTVTTSKCVQPKKMWFAVALHTQIHLTQPFLKSGVKAGSNYVIMGTVLEKVPIVSDVYCMLLNKDIKPWWSWAVLLN